jgi:hypothetical protein
MPAQEIIPCVLSDETRRSIDAYAEALRNQAHTIGDHGLSEEEFWTSGLFRGAIERLRGQQAASMAQKRRFIESVLEYLKQKKGIDSWKFRGTGERHDYEVHINNRICVFEAKECLDGNNTNIFERPANADEFILWSLCQNPGADPRHNAWSGIHTRLSAEIVKEKKRVDGLIIWDMLCGTKLRICPKLSQNHAKVTDIGNGFYVPPPCLYLFPRTVPEIRTNHHPNVWKIEEVKFLKALYDIFSCQLDDVTEVSIEVRQNKNYVERRTICTRNGKQVALSNWTKIKR